MVKPREGVGTFFALVAEIEKFAREEPNIINQEWCKCCKAVIRS